MQLSFDSVGTKSTIVLSMISIYICLRGVSKIELNFVSGIVCFCHDYLLLQLLIFSVKSDLFIYLLSFGLLIHLKKKKEKRKQKNKKNNNKKQTAKQNRMARGAATA